MSTSALISPSVSQDEFQALEQKVLRAVEIVRHEREARAAAEAAVDRLQQQLADQTEEIKHLESEQAALRERFTTQLEQHASTHHAQLQALQQERLDVRQRVEKMLQQMDELL